MRKFLILHNPFAGKQTHLDRIDILKERLDREGYEWTLDESLYHNYFTEKYSSHNHLPYTDIICCGGDGTLNEIINIFWKQDIVISIFPVGTGNDFYAKAGGELDVDSLLDRIIRNEYQLVDIARANEYYFINNSGVGLDVETLRTADKLIRYTPKRAGYKLAAAIEIMVFKPVHGIFRVDGEEFERDFMIAVINNGSYFGGGMMISPASEIDDGQLELMILKRTGRLQLVNLFLKIFSGDHVGHKNIEIFKGKKFEIITDQPMTYHCEGELLGQTPLSIEVIEKAVRIIV